MSTKLTAANVDEIFRKCLHTDEEAKLLMKDTKKGEAPAGMEVTRGIMTMVAFHQGRIADSKPAIIEMVKQLPDEFHKGKGGGMSFLSMCVDKDGTQWGEHPTMDQLVILALAAGVGQYCMPREMWSILPGGMPYVVFDLEL